MIGHWAFFPHALFPVLCPPHILCKFPLSADAIALLSMGRSVFLTSQTVTVV
ncbi:MAG: hypothetical protein ICV54_24200 [Nostoc sp. C3-bin3]|nr:hypothetical protein [Nostoc sp. C3-bin3]